MHQKLQQSIISEWGFRESNFDFCLVLVNCLEKKHRKYILLIFTVLFFSGGIVYPFVWFTQKQEFRMMGDMEVFGFNTYGWVDVENAVGTMFRFYGLSLRLS